MAKLTLTDILVGYHSTANINANNALIEAALENTLSRDGTTPNGMETSLDMNGNRVINAGNAQLSTDLVTLQQLSGITAPSEALPSKTGNAAKVLGTDGTTLGWYDADQILHNISGNIASNRVGDAIDELDSEKVGLALSNSITGTNTFTASNTFNGPVNAAAAAGGGTAYTVTLSPAITAYNTHAIYFVQFTVINTSTTPTIDFNSLGTKTMTRQDGSALLLGDLDGYHALQYDGSTMRVLNPAKRAFRGALVYHSTSQSIPHTTQTTLAFDSEVYDTDVIHDNVTNNSRLTVPTGVTRVRLSCFVAFNGHATGRRSVWITKGGLTQAAQRSLYNDASIATYVQAISAVVTVTSGDFFEVVVDQTSGGALSVLAGVQQIWFAMEIIE